VGICAKNQMNANLIAYPFLMVFMMIPVFGNLSEGLHKISGFLFTGVMTGMTERLAAGEKYVMSPLDMVVLFGELAVSVLVFLMLYKRNGYEKD
jgi:ABC-2 type transport system permease protein